MSSSAGEPPGRRRWRWWIPDYPPRLGRRDVLQIAATALLTVVCTVAALGSADSGGTLRWLFVLAAVLGVAGLVGEGIGVWRARRRPGP